MSEKTVILDIKKELRASMNGVASAAMRQTADYRVNFGVELPRIQEIAAEFTPDVNLAGALWKENVRECRILATLLMPIEAFDEALCDVWVEGIRTVELAQVFALNLMRRVCYARRKAFEWVSGDQLVLQVLGYATMCHVLRSPEADCGVPGTDGQGMDERSANELLDHIACDLQSGQSILQTAAAKTLRIYAAQGEIQTARAKKVADYLF